MLRKILIIAKIIIITFTYTSLCFAGYANLTLVHEDPNLNVTKYIIKYSINPNDDLTQSGTELVLYPENAAAVQSTQLINLGDGKSGSFYFIVKELYEDGTESNFSDKSLPIIIPQKPKNLSIK